MQAQALLNRFAFLESQSGSTKVGNRRSEAGAVARTLKSKLDEQASALDFGAVGNGTADDTTALQNWLSSGARDLYLPPGQFRITASLAMPSVNGLKVLQAGNLSSQIIKDFGGGPAIIWNSGEAVWENCCIDGRGATYGTSADVGILVPSGGGFSSKLINPRIKNTGGSCIRFTSDSGSVWQTRGGLLEPLSAATAAVDHTNIADTGGVNRSFIGVQSGGTLIDFSYMETTFVIGCNTNAVVFGATAKKAIISATRISSSGVTTNLRGTDHSITGCTIAGNVDITVDANNPVVMDNLFAVGYGVTNSGGVAVGLLQQANVNYTPTWSSSGTPPTLGNGTITGRYDRNAVQIHASGSFTFGSTSTAGTGTYRFSLPFNNPGATRVGVARVLDAGTAFFVGVAVSPANTNYVEITTHNTASQVGPTIPMTWAAGDTLLWEIAFNCV